MRLASDLLTYRGVGSPAQKKMLALERVLVATDFGSSASEAVRYGAELARRFKAQLHIVNALEDVSIAMAAGAPGPTYESMEASLEADAQRELDSLATAVRSDGVNVTTEVIRDAQPARAITAYARANQIDLIVVGTHGRSALSQFFLGSVAQRVVRTAPCPTLIVRKNGREFVQPEATSEREP